MSKSAIKRQNRKLVKDACCAMGIHVPPPPIQAAFELAYRGYIAAPKSSYCCDNCHQSVKMGDAVFTQADKLSMADIDAAMKKI